MIAVMSRNAFCIWENWIRVDRESRVWQETWKGLYDDSCTQVLYNMQRGKYLQIRSASSFYPAWKEIRRYGVRRRLRLMRCLK